MTQTSFDERVQETIHRLEYAAWPRSKYFVRAVAIEIEKLRDEVLESRAAINPAAIRDAALEEAAATVLNALVVDPPIMMLKVLASTIRALKEKP